ncbi:hypothetical protein [Candidatus Palauibacter sp.]|uniref:hypothetical protein n=1 Tax=Candidatus Palauibacter sp. TaxID=3101350 RepID=UPI003B5BDA7F
MTTMSGSSVPGLLHRVLPGRCLAHDLHVLGRLQQCLQAGAHHWVVVDQQYPRDLYT